MRHSILNHNHPKRFLLFWRIRQKGYGYNIDSLLEFFKTALSDSDNIHIALVGVGNLGRALLTYNFSIHDEMTITEAFDIDEQIVGTEIGDVSVHHMNDLKKVLNAQNINVVILTTPEEAHNALQISWLKRYSGYTKFHT